MILVIAEQRGGELNRATWEALVAAQQLATRASIAEIRIVVAGDAGSAAQELAGAGIGDVLTVTDAAVARAAVGWFVPSCHRTMLSCSPSSSNAALLRGKLGHAIEPHDFRDAPAAVGSPVAWRRRRSRRNHGR